MAVRKRRVNRAERNIRWIEEHCIVPDGRDVGKPVRLRPWQKKIIRTIYGSPTRMFILSMGRKNAKTTLSAILLLLHLCGPEAHPNSQLYSDAQARDQAALLFALAAKMVRLSAFLSEFVAIRDTAKELYCAELGTLYKALSADASTNFGKSPIFVVHDELGQVRGPRSELYEALETACGAHESPLSIVISTQAPTDGDLLSILIDDALRGQDPELKIILYTSDAAADPFDEKTIKAANPAYGDFLNKKEVNSQAEKARRMPSRENSFRNLILNQRISSQSPFIPRAVWEECAGEIDYELFRHAPVYAGLDLSARNDLTALALIAKDEAGVWHSIVEFFAPEDGVKDRALRDRAPYDLWADQGFITLTPGRSVDYETVARRMGEICDDFDVKCIAFDRWRIDLLKAELSALGLELPLQPYGQGFKDMSPAVETFETEMANKRFLHGNNPVLTWCAANAKAVSDPAGNRKLDKQKSTGRIDGIIAVLMAFGSITKTEEVQAFPYDIHGIRTLEVA